MTGDPPRERWRHRPLVTVHVHGFHPEDFRLLRGMREALTIADPKARYPVLLAAAAPVMELLKAAAENHIIRNEGYPDSYTFSQWERIAAGPVSDEPLKHWVGTLCRHAREGLAAELFPALRLPFGWRVVQALLEAATPRVGRPPVFVPRRMAHSEAERAAPGPGTLAWPAWLEDSEVWTVFEGEDLGRLPEALREARPAASEAAAARGLETLAAVAEDLRARGAVLTTWLEDSAAYYTG